MGSLLPLRLQVLRLLRKLDPSEQSGTAVFLLVLERVQAQVLLGRQRDERWGKWDLWVPPIVISQ